MAPADIEMLRERIQFRVECFPARLRPVGSAAHVFTARVRQLGCERGCKARGRLADRPVCASALGHLDDHVVVTAELGVFTRGALTVVRGLRARLLGLGGVHGCRVLLAGQVIGRLVAL